MVGIATIAFKDLINNYRYKRGMPGMRFAFVPHPITGVPAARVRGFLEAEDPVQGQKVIDRVLAGLTGNLTAAETATGKIERPIP
ncbi:MAG: hypothetical protein IT494_00820, partial [Gammaproteobacteria bacterium]|nr:hypothetical protein [Gammaproteobacteria bacterium]